MQLREDCAFSSNLLTNLFYQNCYFELLYENDLFEKRMLKKLKEQPDGSPACVREPSYLIEIESLIWYFISLVILKKRPIFIQNIRCVNQDIEFENKRIWGT